MTREGLDEAALTGWAHQLGALLAGGDVVLLEGPMGAGKTTLCRALARGLEVERPDRVSSPTFNICVVHEGPTPLVHVDLFRLAELDEGGPVGAAAFEALGLGELAGSAIPGESDSGLLPARRVVVVEWADLWPDPPAEHLRVVIDRPAGAAGPRTVTATGVGARAKALARMWFEVG